MNPTTAATEQGRAPSGKVDLPAPTAWPIVLAFGITLLLAGLVTSASVSILGAALSVVGAIGWFRDVLPVEKEETVEVLEPSSIVTSIRHEVERLPTAPQLPRALLPLEIYPVSAGVKGGLAGGVAMAVLACLYGFLKQGSIWYPINLLAASVYSQSLKFGGASLNSFHADSFLLAFGIHLLTSVLVGLLYGVILPMFPRRPILLGGLIAPIFWTGLLYSVLGVIDPLLNRLIDWRWFIASQFGYGIVAGLIVVRQARVRIRQFLPFMQRAGFEAPGLTDGKRGGEGSR
jgi:hypothetical protein